MADVQFTSQFEEFQFKLTTVTEADFVAEARAVARQVFPLWDNTKAGDIGFFLIRLYIKAVMQGVNLANAWAQEFNILTAREDSSILSHARRLGYTPRSARPARVQALLTFNPSLPATESYAAYGLKLSTRAVDGPDNEVVFENEFPLSIGTGISQVTVPMIAGRSYAQTYTATDEDFQTVTLDVAGVIEGSVRVKFGLVTWQEVDDFVNSGPSDQHFITRLNSDGFTEIEFGDGTNGQRPPNGVTGNLDYRVGGGSKSNIPPNSLTFVVEATLSSLAEGTKPKPVNNPLKATGGQDKETNATIVRKAIDGVRIRDFIGTIADAVKYAEGFDGVARASAQLIGNSLLVFIIPAGGGAAGNVLKTNLQNAMQERVVMGFLVQVADVNPVAPVISVRFTTLPGFVSAEAEAAVAADIKAFLNPLSTVTDPNTRKVTFRRAFGQTLYVNEIRDILIQRPEVAKDFEILAPLADLAVEATRITTDIGAVVTATSVNVQTVGFIPSNP